MKKPKARIGGGLPVIAYWMEKSIRPEGIALWKTLFHKSACLSCAWGTGGQKGGFVNEDGEILQRCAKSVEAIASELQGAIPLEIFNNQTISQLQQLNSQEANNLGRLSHPLIKRANSDHYEPISWEQVYEIIALAFKANAEKIASYSSGRSSNEAAFILQLMMRALGSNNLADCSDLCHVASTVGLREVFGTATSMVSLENLKEADCVVLIGSNAPANHPRLMNELINIRSKGGKVVVVNPTREIGLVKFGSPASAIKSLIPGSTIADHYLQLHPGSDVALFVGIQKAMLEENLVDFAYLKAHCDNWEAVVEQAKSTCWQEIVKLSGVLQKEIVAAAQTIGNCKKVVFAWAMGVTQQVNGVENIISIANTALLGGNAGKLGAGLMPIRGHSNVQGFGSMGVTVNLKAQIQQAIEQLLGKPLSQTKGYDTSALIQAASVGKVDSLICLGGNLYSANPNSGFVKNALAQIETIIYISTKPNQGHFHGLAKQNTLILPVFARFENPHSTTVESGNNFVRLNSPGTSHLKNSLVISEVELLSQIAQIIHGNEPIQWAKLSDVQYIRELIAQTIPGYKPIASIEQTKAEFTIAGRIFTHPQFPTSNGRAQMSLTPLPKLELPEIEQFGLPKGATGIVLSLGTGRSYGQHNTIVYKQGDLYRGMPHRNCIMMNSLDARKIGVAEHQNVTVQGDAGALKQVEVIYGDIKSGAAMMFYPEVNAIFSAQIDPRSGTPAFKRVPVAVWTS